MDDDSLLAICHRVADVVPGALEEVQDLTAAGARPGQYALDLAADRAVLDVLEEAGLGVLSEESGLHRPDSEFIAVVDPVDGSTNASRGIPWYATSVCVLDALGPRAAVVANLSTGVRYHALRGGGAWRDTTRIEPSGCTEMRRAVVALSGYPRRHLGWAQFRALGSAALEMCAVAEGVVDVFSVGGRAHLAPWDYLGAMLLCTEAGATVIDLEGQELVTAEFGARRAVAAAATSALMAELRARRARRTRIRLRWPAADGYAVPRNRVGRGCPTGGRTVRRRPVITPNPTPTGLASRPGWNTGSTLVPICANSAVDGISATCRRSDTPADRSTGDPERLSQRIPAEPFAGRRIDTIRLRARNAGA